MAELDDEARRRLEDMVELVARIAGSDFQARHPISEAADEIDAVAAALNMLAEDFAAERARRELAEGRLRDAIEGYENAPGMFCSVDPGGVVMQCNATMAQWLGRPRDTLVGKPLEGLYSPASRQLMRESLAALIDDRQPPPGDHDIVCADGRVLQTLLSGSVVRDASGRPERLRLIYRDVSEERRLEGQLAQAQKMDGIGRLAGGVAHDFNNLLTAIFCSGEMLRPALTTPEGREDLEQMLGAAARAAELTSHLLAFSRRTVVAPVPTDLNDRLLHVDKLLRRTLGEHIEIVTAASSALWTVVVDPARFEQIVMNLAVNARDAMPRGGRLTLETQNVELDEDYARGHLGVRPGPYVMFAVSDDGVGMPREVMDRLFEPFFTTKDVGKGTGLGLAMVYGIVRQAGGSISVYSEVGRGTTFKIYLPRAEGTPGEARAEVASPPPGGHETILVVEDDAVVRALVLRTLRSAGYQVIEATDGTAGLDLMRHRGQPVDLTLTDMVMPRLGGREMAERLRAEGLCARVLFMSGYTSNSMDHQGVFDPGTEFLQKPFTPATLLSRVRVILDTTRATPPDAGTSIA